MLSVSVQAELTADPDERPVSGSVIDKLVRLVRSQTRLHSAVDTLTADAC